MAQTRKKRKTKHRGNAAGVVEARGRTSRRAEPVKEDRKAAARQARQDRRARPPSWRSAANRALIATLFFIAVIVFALGQTLSQAIAIGGFMLLLYIPFGYYVDLLFYRREQAKRLRERSGS